MKHKAFISRQWRFVRAVCWLALVLIPLIVAGNVIENLRNDRPFDWTLVAVAPAMAVFAVLLAEFIRRWFNFMLGASECRWRTGR